MAQRGALKEVADSELRHLLAYNRSLFCADVQVGDSVPSCKAKKRKSAPRRRGPAKIPDVGDAGATTNFQGQTFKVARYCVRGKVEVQDAGEVD